MLYDLKILFSSSLKFFSSLYLLSASHLKVGCFIAGPPTLGPTFCVLYAPAVAMTCIADLVASTTACTIASLIVVCSLAINVYVLFLLMSAYVKLLH